VKDFKVRTRNLNVMLSKSVKREQQQWRVVSSRQETGAVFATTGRKTVTLDCK